MRDVGMKNQVNEEGEGLGELICHTGEKKQWRSMEKSVLQTVKESKRGVKGKT